MGLFLAGVAAAGTVLFEDGFKGYPPGSAGEPLWQVESGAWAVTPEGFLGKDCEGFFTAVGARTGLREWSDYALTLQLKLVSRGSDWRDGPWIGFRCLGGGNGYTLGFYSRVTVLHKASAGAQTRDGSELATSPFVLADSDWHRVSIRVQGAQIAVAVDGTSLMEVADKDWNGSPPVTGGGIVLGARREGGAGGSTQVLFREVKVEAPGEAAADLVYTAGRARQQEKPRMSMIQYVKSRQERHWTGIPRRVLAFYYTWYGTPQRHGRWVHWDDVRPEQHDIASATHYPAKGAYDSHDPAVLADHIRQAKAAGLDGFITTWWGQGSFDDRAFPLVLEEAAKQGFEATVYWETAPGKGRAQIDQAIRDLVYLVTVHGRHPAFLKVDGKPVIFVYGRVMGEVPLGNWPDIITGARAAAGSDFVLVADGYSDAFARVFDGIHTYNIAGEASGRNPEELRRMAAESFAGAVALARRRQVLSCLTIIPGYDDTKIRKPGLKTERHDGATYRVLWEEAIRAAPDWVLITSWNEWHEGSEIEPSWEDGERYLEITAELAPRFHTASARAQPAAAAGPLATLSAERAQDLQRLYRGAEVAILPDPSGDTAFWLAETGLAFRELSWDDVVAPTGLTPARFPVALYAAGENYVQSLQREKDVDEGLLRYLRAGGLLLCVSPMPFPFYYNEQGKGIANAACFGIPISGSGAFGREDGLARDRLRGWEKPPSAGLTFRLDREALPSVPAQAPFPPSGDQRWRPCVRQGLATDDIYLPLARLVDGAGNEYGDGIVYVERHRSEPVGGKALYVWMRMPDVLGQGDLLYDVFRFAATHMARPQAEP